MGYTHYWKNNIEVSDEIWKEFTDKLTQLIDASDIHVCEEYNTPHLPPVVVADNRVRRSQVRLNGALEKGHETFFLAPWPQQEFCKTARKPYDLIVTCALCLAADMFPDFQVESDGTHDEWEPATAFARSVLGEYVGIPKGVQAW